MKEGVSDARGSTRSQNLGRDMMVDLDRDGAI